MELKENNLREKGAFMKTEFIFNFLPKRIITKTSNPPSYPFPLSPSLNLGSHNFQLFKLILMFIFLFPNYVLILLYSDFSILNIFY